MFIVFERKNCCSTHFGLASLVIVNVVAFCPFPQTLSAFRVSKIIIFSSYVIAFIGIGAQLLTQKIGNGIISVKF